MPYAALIPMPAIAAILFMVAYNMCQWRTFVHLAKTAPKSDIIVLVLTFALTVFFDLVVAIEIGMLLACLLLMKRMSEETNVVGWTYTEDEDDPDSINLRKVPKYVRVYEITGSLFFGAADEIASITVKDFTKCLVIRMRAVNALDATAMHSLEELCGKLQKKGIVVVFSHVNEQPMHVMQKAGFVEKIGQENFCEHIDAALERASVIGAEG
jgi:SulP family sulfate permease